MGPAMSAMNFSPTADEFAGPRSLAIVIGLESGHALVPPEMTDEHRKTIITSQVRGNSYIISFRRRSHLFPFANPVGSVTAYRYQLP